MDASDHPSDLCGRGYWRRKFGGKNGIWKCIPERPMEIIDMSDPLENNNYIFLLVWHEKILLRSMIHVMG